MTYAVTVQSATGQPQVFYVRATTDERACSAAVKEAQHVMREPRAVRVVPAEWVR